MKILLLSLLSLLITTSCIHYTFSGSTLPSHLKTVEIPLIENSTAQIGIEDKLRDEVYNAFASRNLLQIVENYGDANLKIKIESYTNSPADYDAAGNVKTYKVTISVHTTFFDNKEGKTLYEGVINGIGIYNHTSETELNGREVALRQIRESIINHTISGW